MKHRERVNISNYLQRLLQKEDTEIIYVKSKEHPEIGVKKFVRIQEDIEWKVGFENDVEADKGEYLYVTYPRIMYSSIERIKQHYDIVDKLNNED